VPEPRSCSTYRLGRSNVSNRAIGKAAQRLWLHVSRGQPSHRRLPDRLRQAVLRVGVQSRLIAASIGDNGPECIKMDDARAEESKVETKMITHYTEALKKRGKQPSELRIGPRDWPFHVEALDSFRLVTNSTYLPPLADKRASRLCWLYPFTSSQSKERPTGVVAGSA